MFFQFFDELRRRKVPVTLKEYLALMDALVSDVIEMKIDEFYYLSRAALVKDERNLDKFDRVFAHVFKGLETLDATEIAQIPEEWLRALTEKFLTEEEKKQIEALGGWEKLMETLKQRLEEQKKRHEGGSKMIGTAGTSPFGAKGYNPEGVRIGQDKGRHGQAVKVWDKREYKNLDDSVELGTRNIKVALRRLRKWARRARRSNSICPARSRKRANKGYLDLKLVPERHNTVKVLLFFDIGGSMDAHIELCEELFSAAEDRIQAHGILLLPQLPLRSGVEGQSPPPQREIVPTWDVLHKFPHDYKVIFVGDATMSPYEITYPGGSVEHWNEEAGAVWLDRVTQIYEHVVWLNPVAEKHWEYTPSIGLIRQMLSDRMYPLTLAGLDAAMRELNR